MNPSTKALSVTRNALRSCLAFLACLVGLSFATSHAQLSETCAAKADECADRSEVRTPSRGLSTRVSEATRTQDSSAVEEADVDPYFQETSAITSEDGPQAITRNVLQDRHGNYWLATWNGVVHYDGTTFTNLTNKEGLRRHRVFSLLEDRQGNIWIGTIGAGLYRYDGATYTNITTKDGLLDDTVLSIYEDKDGVLWFGGLGLTKYDGNTFTTFTEADGFTNADVHAIDQSPDGTLWFGTRGALYRFDGKAFTNVHEEHDVPVDKNSYTPTLVDRNGHVWFGGPLGIYHLDGERVRQVYPLESFTLFEDSRGHIWFSGGGLEGDTPRRGMTVLNHFDPASGLDNLRDSSKRHLIHSGSVFGLTEDKDGTIWFGTGGGVGRLTGKLAQYF